MTLGPTGGKNSISLEREHSISFSHCKIFWVKSFSHKFLRGTRRLSWNNKITNPWSSRRRPPGLLLVQAPRWKNGSTAGPKSPHHQPLFLPSTLYTATILTILKISWLYHSHGSNFHRFNNILKIKLKYKFFVYLSQTSHCSVNIQCPLRCVSGTPAAGLFTGQTPAPTPHALKKPLPLCPPEVWPSLFRTLTTEESRQVQNDNQWMDSPKSWCLTLL